MCVGLSVKMFVDYGKFCLFKSCQAQATLFFEKVENCSSVNDV